MTKHKKNKSGYKGVCWYKNRWQVTIWDWNAKKNVYIGFFQDKEEASNAYQEAIQKLGKRPTFSGYKGVYNAYSKKKEKWRAAITIQGKCIYLGLFDTKEEAHDAYLKAREHYVNNEERDE